MVEAGGDVVGADHVLLDGAAGVGRAIQGPRYAERPAAAVGATVHFLLLVAEGVNRVRLRDGERRREL